MSETITKGFLLEDLTWKQAQVLLTANTIIVIPIGAQAKEHGHHLPLKNDYVMAEYLKNAIAQRLPVVVAPTINYSFYPAFVEYPGSVSLSAETSASMFKDIVRSFSRFGPRRFYFLNTGISTIRPLKTAKEELEHEGLFIEYSDLRILLDQVRSELEEQEGGTHADEIETSIMLYMAPSIVDMDKALPDFTGNGAGPLCPEEREGTVYSPTGAWGDPTKASREKGEKLVAALITGITHDIKELLRAAGTGISTEN
ncbi:MAG: creatininase family protein [Candidatus Obscuribacterales bacterium]|nr:creatininase family protein [Candidatus Obscuribacterales bacterium]